MTDDEFDGEFITLCQEMIEAWRAVPTPSVIRLPDDSRASWSDVGAVAVVWGWTARVARTAEAALTLHRDGFDVELAPMLRSMLEHTIAIPWVVDARGSAYQVLARERADSWVKFDKAQEAGWKLDEEKAALLATASKVETDDDTRSGDTMLRTLHRATKYGLGSLYQGWLIATWTTHATMMSAEPYFDFDPSNPTKGRLGRIPKDDGSRVSALIVLAVHAAFTGYELLEPLAFSGLLATWQERFESLMQAMTPPQ